MTVIVRVEKYACNNKNIPYITIVHRKLTPEYISLSRPTYNYNAVKSLVSNKQAFSAWLAEKKISDGIVRTNLFYANIKKSCGPR